MVDLYLFYVWCASVAGDIKEYIAVAESSQNALSQVPCWYRQDLDIHYATMGEVLRLGAELDNNDTVAFEDKFFVFDKELNRFEYDCDINYIVRPELYKD